VPDPPPLLLFVLVLLVSLVEPLPEVVPVLLPVPLVVPEPEPEPLTEPEPLVVPVLVDDDDPSEQPDNPRPRLNDMSAAVNRYFWFRIYPPFAASNRYAPIISSNRYANLSNLLSFKIEQLSNRV
jgi:hypothetical protein